MAACSLDGGNGEVLPCRFLLLEPCICKGSSVLTFYGSGSSGRDGLLLTDDCLLTGGAVFGAVGGREKRLPADGAALLAAGREELQLQRLACRVFQQHVAEVTADYGAAQPLGALDGLAGVQEQAVAVLEIAAVLFDQTVGDLPLGLFHSHQLPAPPFDGR